MASLPASSRPVYPGLGLSLRWDPCANQRPFFPIGAHVNCPGAASDLLPIREVAMMLLMDRLTDKPNWHRKVFDDDIVGRWRQEALAQPEDDLYREITDGRKMDKIPKPACRLISEQAFDYVPCFRSTNLFCRLLTIGDSA
jgi:hypothetical protein